MDEEENEHPRPWKRGSLSEYQVFDDDGGFVATCRDEKIAALIVRLVNAKGKGKG